jgi:hypothetical protein
MQTRPRPLRMTPGERLAAGYVTGPVGHFIAGSTDLALAVGRLLVARGLSGLRDRDRRRRQRFSE